MTAIDHIRDDTDASPAVAQVIREHDVCKNTRIAHIRSDAYSRQQVPGGLTRDSFPRWAGLRGGSR